MDRRSKTTITVYHGTTIEEAQTALSHIKASKGYGEFGQGLYTVFSPQQAYHIAQYYWDAEQKYLKGKSGVAVVAIEIVLEDWQGWISQGEILCYQTDVVPSGVPLPVHKRKWGPEEYAQGDDKGRDRGLAVIIGPIKDRKTPYLQVVFGSRAQKGLERAKKEVVCSMQAQAAIGQSAYPNTEAMGEKGALNQLLGAQDVVAKFKAGAAEHKSFDKRKEFVTHVFGGFNAKDLPDGEEGQALVQFLTASGLKTGETTPDGVIYDYIQKGLPE